MDAITETVCGKREIMNRYIDADKLKEEWLQVYDSNDFLESIDDQPTADVEPTRHAHWEPYNRNGSIEYRCSFCNYGWKNKWKDYYCPHCGAKMDESVEK